MCATDPQKISADSSYEVSIQDNRIDTNYETGAVVKFALAHAPLVDKTAERWNTMQVTAIGQSITVKFNGVKTVTLKTVNFQQSVSASIWSGSQ